MLADGTAELVEQFIYSCNQQDRVTLIKNKTRKRALANLYYALQLCEPDEIVFNYDGDDWLAHDHVFAMINEIYQDPNIWITYGQFQNWPTNEMGYCQPISEEMVQKQLFRKKWWKPGQLRTFYAWLFHQIQLKDLFFEGPYFQGQFFPANSDLAIYYPMMEMAGPHYKFISDVIYIRNVATPINDFKANKEVQILGSKLIREKEKYPFLDAPQINYFDQFKGQRADLIIFSKNPSQAQKLITSCQKLMRNAGTVHLMYEASDEKIEEQFHNINSYKLEITHIPTQSKTFKTQLLDILMGSASAYVLFAHDGMILNHYIDCSECIYALEHAFAYGFYLSLGNDNAISHQTGISQPMPALNQLTDAISAWAFHYADSGDWRCSHNLACTLYRKKTVVDQLQTLEFKNYHELFANWSKIPINLEQVGLCYEKSKIGYINWY